MAALAILLSGRTGAGDQLARIFDWFNCWVRLAAIVRLFCTDPACAVSQGRNPAFTFTPAPGYRSVFSLPFMPLVYTRVPFPILPACTAIYKVGRAALATAARSSTGMVASLSRTIIVGIP